MPSGYSQLSVLGSLRDVLKKEHVISHENLEGPGLAGMENKCFHLLRDFPNKVKLVEKDQIKDSAVDSFLKITKS